MDFFFLILLVVLLLIFGYAQHQKGVFRTTGEIKMSDEEEI
jgi:hypothetical protein